MIIVEGIDGTGKSTVIDMLGKYGYSRYYFPYDMKNQDLVTKYLSVLDNTNQRMALDRSFVSETVYGPVMRNFSKLSIDQLRFLLDEYNKNGFQLMYLHACKKLLMERRKDDLADLKMISENYSRLTEQYNMIIEVCSEHLPVHRYDTGTMRIDEIETNAGKVFKL